MTTVIVRDATEAPQDDITPTVPALKEITKRINAREWPYAGLPLAIEAELFDRAQKEMRSILLTRGFSDLPIANIPKRNFLFYGYTVVCEDD